MATQQELRIPVQTLANNVKELYRALEINNVDEWERHSCTDPDLAWQMLQPAYTAAGLPNAVRQDGLRWLRHSLSRWLSGDASHAENIQRYVLEPIINQLDYRQEVVIYFKEGEPIPDETFREFQRAYHRHMERNDLEAIDKLHRKYQQANDQDRRKMSERMFASGWFDVFEFRFRAR